MADVVDRKWRRRASASIRARCEAPWREQVDEVLRARDADDSDDRVHAARRPRRTPHRAPRSSAGGDADRRALASGCLVVKRARFRRARTLLEILDTVMDPEVPVISVVELGIVRDAVATDDGRRRHDHTDVLRLPGDARDRDGHSSARSSASGLGPVEVRTTYTPAWTTDWIAPARATSSRRTASRRRVRSIGRNDLVLAAASDGDAFAVRIANRWTPSRRASSDRPRASRSGCADDCRQPFEEFKAI